MEYIRFSEQILREICENNKKTDIKLLIDKEKLLLESFSKLSTQQIPIKKAKLRSKLLQLSTQNITILNITS